MLPQGSRACIVRPNAYAYTATYMMHCSMHSAHQARVKCEMCSQLEPTGLIFQAIAAIYMKPLTSWF